MQIVIRCRRGHFAKNRRHWGLCHPLARRPDPIAISTCYATFTHQDQGRVGLAWTDGWDGSSALDIKPYAPSVGRVEEPTVPAWRAHWTHTVETSGDFDWEAEFNF